MVLGGILFVSCQSEIAPDTSATSSVSFALEADATTRASSALAVGSTLRVIAYLRTPGQTGYPDANRRDECTYKVEADGALKLCAVNADGTVDAVGTPTRDMALAPGTYDFYAISPALRIYHEPTNPMVAVRHGVDFASSFTPKTVTAGANNILLATLSRQCVKLNFKTDRQPTLPDLTKIRVQSLTLEAMTDEPVWATAGDTLVLTGNTYTSTIRIPGSAFSVPVGNADYQQTADTFCLPRLKGDFRLRASVLYNADTMPTVLETTVSGTAFAAGSSNNLTLYFGYEKIKVEVTNGWTDSSGAENFGVVDLNRPFGGRTANCYIVTDNIATNYCFDATKRGNGQESTIDPNLSGINYSMLPVMNTATEARLIWQTGTNASTLVIDPASVKLINKRVYFATTGRVNEGNAVIGIYASSAENAPCVWSWHIWKLNGSEPGAVLCTKTSATTGVDTQFYMMDRNLGAYDNRMGYPSAIGSYYQWGRKDPFPGLVDYWDHVGRTVYGSWNNGGTTGTWDGQYSIKTALTSVGGTEAWAVNYPTAFVISENPQMGDWMITKNDYLWGTPWQEGGLASSVCDLVTYPYNKNQGTKSIYDPCPVGYRVPPHDTWSKVSSSSPLTDLQGTMMNLLSANFWFPFSGGLVTLTGLPNNQSSWIGICWSSSSHHFLDQGYSGYCWFDGWGTVVQRFEGRGAGMSVRCVME